MKTVYVRLLTLVFALAALACGAQAQSDQINFTVDHDFVVLGKTLPAGTYKVFRGNNDTRELIFSSVENHDGAIVLATETEANPGGGAKAKFEVVGGQFVLTQIETEQRVFSIPVSKALQAELAARHQSSTLSSVSVGTK